MQEARRRISRLKAVRTGDAGQQMHREEEESKGMFSVLTSRSITGRRSEGSQAERGDTGEGGNRLSVTQEKRRGAFWRDMLDLGN